MTGSMYPTCVLRWDKSRPVFKCEAGTISGRCQNQATTQRSAGDICTGRFYTILLCADCAKEWDKTPGSPDMRRIPDETDR